MTHHGPAQAAEFLLVVITTRPRANVRDQLSVFFNLIYQDTLNREPRDGLDTPAAVQEVCDRFGEILVDHIALESLLLALASTATGTPAETILRQIADRAPRR